MEDSNAWDGDDALTPSPSSAGEECMGGGREGEEGGKVRRINCYH